MSDPINHHYVPVFYLSRWATDGRVCCFSRPFGSAVKPKRVVPKGTGYKARLYEVSVGSPAKDQSMETGFLSPLDSQAAEALVLLESRLPEAKWTSGPRSAWSRFILAQMLRSPEDIAQLKSSARQSWAEVVPELDQIYSRSRRPEWPSTLDEYLQLQSPSHADELALGIARRLIDHSGLGGSINNMYWHVIEFPEDCFPLLTSDRPVWMTPSFSEADAFIAIPIGPRRLFTATVHQSTTLRLRHRNRKELAKQWNRITANHAVDYVYGVDDKMLNFVQKHMAARRHSSLVERLAVGYGHDIVSPTSPAALLEKRRRFPVRRSH